MKKVLLPHSLLADHAFDKLCTGLAPLPELAARFDQSLLEPFNGTWGDAWRLAIAPPANAVGGAGDEGVNAIATPLSAALGLTDLTVLHPEALQLGEDESRRLCAACSEHLAVEGVRLSFLDATRWRLTADAPVSALTEPPQWIIGEPLRPNLPRGDDARRVERWMNELQMLLYTHPVNSDREDRGLDPVNVIWLWSFAREGDPGPGNASQDSNVSIDDFAKAYRSGDGAAWQQHWATHAAAIQGADVLFLGDAQPRLKLSRQSRSAAASFFARLRRPPKLADVLLRLRGRATA